MNFLFFDIECADGNKAICEYGYVLTDEKFNVIKKVNILIDPQKRFNLRGRRDKKDLFLTYPYDEYRKHYPFDDAYENIKRVMEQKNLLIFGHSVINDIGFLFKDCKRYKLPIFNFNVIDIQKILRYFSKKNPKFSSLDKAFIDLVPEDIRFELLDHRACDDAMKTMLVFKAMAEDLEFSVNELIDSCPKAVINAFDYWEFNKTREEKKKNKKNSGSHKCQVLWGDLYRECLPLLNEYSSIGKIVAVSGGMKEHLLEFEELVKSIKENKYVAYDKVNGSDYFIVFNEEEREQIKSVFKYPYKGKILTFKEFLNLNLRDKL